MKLSPKNFTLAELLLIVTLAGITLAAAVLLIKTVSRGPSHVDDIRAIAFSPDGRTLATAGWFSSTVKLWDARTGRPQGTINKQFGPVRRLQFSPDGRTLAALENSRTVELWDSRSRERRAAVDASHAVGFAFFPDGRTLATTGVGLRLWDLATGRLARTFSRPFCWDGSVAFSPNGEVLATAHRDWGAEYVVKLWNVATGVELMSARIHGHVRLALSPDGTTLAASDSREVRMWDVTSGAERTPIPAPRANSVAFSPDGELLATTGGESVRVWDIPTCRQRWIASTTDDFVAHSATFSPDGKTLATILHNKRTDDASLKLWDGITSQPLPFVLHEYDEYQAGKWIVLAGSAVLWIVAWTKVRRRRRAITVASEARAEVPAP